MVANTWLRSSWRRSFSRLPRFHSTNLESPTSMMRRRTTQHLFTLVNTIRGNYANLPLRLHVIDLINIYSHLFMFTTSHDTKNAK